ncbi:hypothetical protein Nepgr_019020 [Nepenthes gracilis]|uniref:RING-type E3 ubiquitin transferase n=1 Tax=Nepenthes gracilis TaxID=150966 RepID=A0AAD3SV00_NEPGR|nr:hypothetical protein Nepgr_019020 [Nepenthes gracilis]
MPNCQHAFHIPCIDTWLKSQSNCPLCRSAMIDQHHPLPVVREGSGTPASVNVSAMRVENRSDVVVVVRDMGIVEHRLEIANSNDGGVDDFSNNEQRNEMRKEEIQR